VDRHAARAGLTVAENVLGAGLLVMPAVGAAVAGPRAVPAWVVTLAAGLAFCAVVGRAGAGASLAEVLGRRSGPAATVVTGLYLAGFTGGQTALALFAGTVVGGAFGVPAEPVAVAVLAVAGFAAIAGVRLTPAARRLRLAGAAVLAIVMCVSPGWFNLPATSWHGVVPAAFLLLFAVVGGEAIARTGTRTVAVTVAVAAAVLVPVHLGLAVMLATARPAGTPHRGLAIAAAALIALFCTTNLPAAGGFASRLMGRPQASHRPWTAAVTVAAVVILVPAQALGWGAVELFAIPATATALSYAVVLAVAGPRVRSKDRIPTMKGPQ